jgi:murein L,D-transpeptidase YafK
MKKRLLLVVLIFAYSVMGEERVDFIKVEKSKHLVTLYSAGKRVVSYRAVFGPNPKGHKVREGDGKTPEGVYTLDRKNESSNYHKSIHVSYPSAQDLAKAKKLGVSPGGNIMIHGQKNGFGMYSTITQRFNWTAGCIALSNDDMDDLWKRISVPTKIEILP